VIVLDTHIWVRWLDPQVNPLPCGLIEMIEAADQVVVSAVSCWEVAWLSRRGRLQLGMGLHDWMDNALKGSNVGCIALNRSISLIAASLPEHHRDPADRFIIATAIDSDAQLMSFDNHFPDYLELAGKLIQN
jgi:PIN domain nuclease of toxin-antitoxin system